MPSVNSPKLPPSATKPIRILHVVGGMDRGGVETWLMHVLRQLAASTSSSDNRSQFQMDFLTPEARHYEYTQELESLGSQILPCLEPSDPWRYATNFKRILDEYGPYDIVHVHVHLFSGYVLYLAAKLGVKARIIHSHSDTSSIESTAKWPRQIYNTLMKWSISSNATGGLVASHAAAVNLLGSAWQKDLRWQALACGINLAPFNQQLNSGDIRAEFDLPTDALIIGHVGRFDLPKNHDFLLEIAAEISKREPKMYLLLIGTGDLRPKIEAKAAQMGLIDRVIFLGARPDVPRLMTGLMDVFLFPSLYEGLGLVLIEAQAAGLPCIVADTIPPEADLIKPLIHRLSLQQSAVRWAEVLLEHSKYDTSISPAQSLQIVSQSVFNIDVSVAALTKFYRSAATQNVAR
jgi:glycosyltransferase involved in cell wall biosynthesis